MSAEQSADVPTISRDEIEAMRHEMKCAMSNLWTTAAMREDTHAEIDRVCDAALRSLKQGTDEPFCWLNEKNAKLSFAENLPGPDWIPLYRTPQSASGSYEQVCWAKLGTMDGKLYVQSTRNMREGQTEYHFHPIFVRTADSGAQP